MAGVQVVRRGVVMVRQTAMRLRMVVVVWVVGATTRGREQGHCPS